MKKLILLNHPIMAKTFIVSIAIFFFFPMALIAQKKKKEISSISISSGFLINNYTGHSVPITVEYQYTHRKSNFGGGIQVDFEGRDVFISNDVYEFLPRCTPKLSSFGSQPLHCPYSFTYDFININLLTSYQYNFVQNKKMSIGIKSSVLFLFEYYTHYTDKYPKINTVTGVLLDPGPFESEYTRKKWKFEDIGVAVAPVFQYHLNRHLSPFVSVHLQHRLDDLAFTQYADTWLFALLGLKVKI